MAVAARPALVLPGLKPVDRSLETHWVRPGAATAVPLRPRRPDHGRQPRRGPGRRAHRRSTPRGARTRRRSAPAPTSTRRCCASSSRAARADGFLAELHAERPRARRRPRAAPVRRTRPRADAVEEFVAEREAIAIVAAPGGRVVEGDWPASPLLIEVRRAVPRELRGGRAAGAARRAAARLPRRPRQRGRLRGEGGRVHPDHRRPGQAVLGLPRLQPRASSRRQRARARRDHDALADGLGVSAARPLPQELRRRHGPAGRGGPGHRGPPRQLRARLQRQVLRGPRLPRARQLLGQLQRRR